MREEPLQACGLHLEPFSFRHLNTSCIWDKKKASQPSAVCGDTHAGEVDIYVSVFIYIYHTQVNSHSFANSFFRTINTQSLHRGQ